MVGDLEVNGDPSDPTFIPYNELTEEIVIDWVKSFLGTSKINEIETSLQNSVTNQKLTKEAETVKTGLPWR